MHANEPEALQWNWQDTWRTNPPLVVSQLYEMVDNALVHIHNQLIDGKYDPDSMDLLIQLVAHSDGITAVAEVGAFFQRYKPDTIRYGNHSADFWITVGQSIASNFQQWFHQERPFGEVVSELHEHLTGYAAPLDWKKTAEFVIGLRLELQDEKQRMLNIFPRLFASSKAGNASNEGTASPNNTKPSNQEMNKPTEILWGWPDILACLNLKKEDKGKLERLNKMYSGPIVIGRRGSQPSVIKASLLEWWESLANRLIELQNRSADKTATVLPKYQHGKDAVVVPEIEGQVKKRRGSDNKT